MLTYNEGLLRYLTDIKDHESLADPFRVKLYRRYSEHIHNLVKGRLGLFVDRVNYEIGICDIVTTCGVRKTQPFELLKSFPSFKAGYDALLEQFRPLNADMLKKYWEMSDDLAKAISVGKVELSQIDTFKT